MGKVERIKWGNKSHKDWLTQRAAVEGLGELGIVRIGASDVPVITGANTYKSKGRLFYHLTGYHSSSFITETTLAGHLMEPVTIKRWEAYEHGDEEASLQNALYGIRVRKMRKADFFITNSDYPHLFASLDYIPSGKSFSPFTGERYKPLTPNELKHTNWAFRKLWPETGITQAHLEQLHVQMMSTNTSVAVFHVMVDGVKYEVQEIERDGELCKFVNYETKQFADTVIAGKVLLESIKIAESQSEAEEYQAMFDEITPEPEVSDDITLYGEIYEEGNELTMQGDDTDSFHMAQYLKCNKVSKTIDDYKTSLRAKLVAKCAEWEGIETNEFKMTNRRARDGKKAYFSIKAK